MIPDRIDLSGLNAERTRIAYLSLDERAFIAEAINQFGIRRHRKVWADTVCLHSPGYIVYCLRRACEPGAGLSESCRAAAWDLIKQVLGKLK